MFTPKDLFTPLDVFTPLDPFTPSALHRETGKAPADPLLGLKFKQRENSSLKTNRQPVGRGQGKNSVLPTGIAALRREMANPLPQ